MRNGILCFFVLCISFAGSAHADQVFFEFDSGNGFLGSPGVPDDAFKLLQSAQKTPNAPLKCFAFTPGGHDWLFLFGGNSYYTSNLALPICKKLTELQKENADLKCVAFAPTGGWTVLWGQNGNWTEGRIPDDAFKKMQEVAKNGGTLRSIAFGPGGSWVILFDKSGVLYGGIPRDLATVLNDAVKRGLTVSCVAFAGRDWICLTNNGWWSSNLDLPASKQIGQSIQDGRSPTWIAIKPEYGKHDFAKWSEIIHGALDGKIAAGYAFEVLDHGKVVAKGAEGWARTPWEKENPSVKWTLDKPMGVASVSKTVTAVSVLKLWEETNRSFSLDDPFWPHIKAICPTAHADVKKVTIRQLLTHRSGFKSGGADCIDPKALEKLLNEPLAHKSGTFYEYQNNNFYIAHLLIEQIGHVQYTPYVKAHVLKPMGIAHMEAHFEAHETMCGYGKLGDTRPGYPFDWQCDAWVGAAGWYASASDLGRFVNGIRDHKVLDAATTEMMIKESMGWDNNDPGAVKNGGWSWDEPPRYGDFESAIGHFPDGVDAVLLVNCVSPEDVEALVVRAWTESMQD